MRKIIWSAVFLSLCWVIVSVTGCSRHYAKAEPAAPDVGAVTVPMYVPPEATPVPPTDYTDYSEDLEGLVPIYFSFNKADIRNDQLSALKHNAQTMRGRVLLEGYADERGMSDYNLALGERRAEAVRLALIRRYGVSKSALRSVSYGEDRPVDAGHTEDAYARNRRVEFREE